MSTMPEALEMQAATERRELEPLDLIWGVASIAQVIGRTERQTEIALGKHELPGRKINGRWVCSRRKLVEHFEGIDND